MSSKDFNYHFQGRSTAPPFGAPIAGGEPQSPGWRPGATEHRLCRGGFAEAIATEHYTIFQFKLNGYKKKLKNDAPRKGKTGEKHLPLNIP